MRFVAAWKPNNRPVQSFVPIARPKLLAISGRRRATGIVPCSLPSARRVDRPCPPCLTWRHGTGTLEVDSILAFLDVINNPLCTAPSERPSRLLSVLASTQGPNGPVQPCQSCRLPACVPADFGWHSSDHGRCCHSLKPTLPRCGPPDIPFWRPLRCGSCSLPVLSSLPAICRCYLN
ncbi:hypothetical protein BT67DRAFT_170681 [Trichocladium antarcticum]|uniref:Uncharacterized protein n=1 Tax=Trichocladium antarcticum TaxID=1450529 RepID=A0AAN6UE16_9PEZI|nr:hypothetical protein BT67DRAFT_170681 [Trichocladium antarcticum]